jgi:NAD+ kinase
MRIAIYSRGLESEQLDGLKILLDEFSHYNIEAVIYQDFFNVFYSSIDIKNKYSTFNHSNDLEEIDFIISLGGDGTLLDAVTFVGDKGIPILGINYGRLGFLASIVRVGQENLHDRQAITGSFGCQHATF